MTSQNVWDQPIDVEPNEFIALPAGIYAFRVVGYERGFTGEKSKNPGEPMLTLKLEVYGDKLGTSAVFHRIVWNDKNKWKQSEFFIGIGQRKHGDTAFCPRWNEVVGATGYVKLKVREYNGSNTNDVDSILDPEKISADQVGAETPTYTPGKF